MSDRGKLGSFLKEIISWRWDEFIEAEHDQKYTGYQAAVFSLVRICSDGKLGAIKLAIDRVDGKVETPIKVEYPKIYFLFPEAKSVALPPPGTPVAALTAGDSVEEKPPEAKEKEEPVTAATLTLRQTLEKMADHPRILTQLILQRKKQVENGKIDDAQNVPLVKSVIAANLLNLAEKNNFEAITEVFDQIDGKLVETIRILGDNIYLTQYLEEAPYGAVKNKNGVYQIEATQVTKVWKQKLKKS